MRRIGKLGSASSTFEDGGNLLSATLQGKGAILGTLALGLPGPRTGCTVVQRVFHSFPDSCLAREFFLLRFLGCGGQCCKLPPAQRPSLVACQMAGCAVSLASFLFSLSSFRLCRRRCGTRSTISNYADEVCVRGVRGGIGWIGG